jgi:catechol 2,3-dioxygenase-like lactoylglutathione lyase family enzyme
MSGPQRLTAILPCNDLDASEAFYAKLGFAREAVYDGYRILADGQGAEIHLNLAVKDWLVPDHNPFGIYLYTDRVDELAGTLGDLVIAPPEDKPWGMYEFGVSDPNGTLVRIGRPTVEPTVDKKWAPLDS